LDQQKQSRRHPTGRQLLWTSGIVTVLIISILIGYRYDITLWDWIKLLLVPAVIAAGGVLFDRQQRDREIALAEQRAQDDALQAYLDHMSNMLIPNKEQPSLYKACPGDSLSDVARARTLTVLRGLDETRKGSVLSSCTTSTQSAQKTLPTYLYLFSGPPIWGKPPFTAWAP
jgi:hypothetical protein